MPGSAGSPTAARRTPSTERLAASWVGLRELGPLGLLFAAIVALPFAGTAILATTSTTWAPWFALDGERAMFSSTLAVLLFVTATALCCGLSVLPTYAASMAGGYLYGGVAGSMVVLLGITLAAALGRVVMAWIAGERLMHYVASKPKLAAVHQALLGDAATGVTTVVTLVRLAPVTPFAGTNLVMAAAKVSAGPFVAGTLLGLGPRVVLFVLAGAGLAELEFGEDTNPASLWLGGVSLLVSMAGLWVVAKRRLGAILDDRDREMVPRADPASHRHRRQVDDP